MCIRDRDYTGGPGSPYKYKLDAADTDYYVIAFGYAGGVTTAPVMETFRSLDVYKRQAADSPIRGTYETNFSASIGISPGLVAFAPPSVLMPDRLKFSLSSVIKFTLPARKRKG